MNTFVNAPTLLHASIPSHATSNSDGTVPADDSIFLLELPQGLTVEDILSGSTIAGSTSDTQAALVTQGSSYRLTKVESSNTFVLLPPTAPSDENEQPAKRRKVTATIAPNYYYELNTHRLDVARLKTMLTKGLYEGYAEETEEKVGSRMTFEELCVTLQAGDKTLRSALLEVGAFLIDGKYCLVGEELMNAAFEEILAVVSAEEWDLDSVSISNLSKAVTGDISLEKEVVAHCARLNSNGEPSDADDELSLSPSKIAVFKARKLLSSRGAYPMKEFTLKWHSEMPHQCTGFTPSPELLDNLCVKEWDPKISDYKLDYFSASNLPMAAGDRFSKLFAVRSEWKVKELTPFLKGLGGDVEALLLKYSVLRDGVDDKLATAKPAA